MESNRIDVLTVVGARPQFVKAAVVSKALKNHQIHEVILHTGQHFDYAMDGVFFEELEIPKPAFNLAAGGGSQGKQTAMMLEGIEKFLLELPEFPRMILVYGDTNSTIAAAMAGAKLHIPIVHVEAGLRSYNRLMPEEINRVLTDQLSAMLFCTSQEGVTNLSKEGIKEGVYDVGDVMCDAFHHFSKLSDSKYAGFHHTIVDGPFALMTIHRPSNTENHQNLAEILTAVAQIPHQVVWPVHPRMKDKMDAMVLPKNLLIATPFSYLQMLQMLHGASFVITDSGGLQKEAYWAKKKCITVRTETEWVETVQVGWNFLTGPDAEKIVQAIQAALPADHPELYGTGEAAQQIALQIGKVMN